MKTEINIKDIEKSLDRWFKDLNTDELERVSEIDVSEYEGKGWKVRWILVCYEWWDNLNVDTKQEIFDNYTGK